MIGDLLTQEEIDRLLHGCCATHGPVAADQPSPASETVAPQSQENDDWVDLLDDPDELYQLAFANDTIGLTAYQHYFAQQGTHDVFAKTAALVLFDTELRSFVTTRQFDASLKSVCVKARKRIIPKRSSIPVEQITKLIDLVNTRDEPLLLQTLFKQFHNTVKIITGFQPAHIDFLLEELQRLPADITLVDALALLGSLSASLKFYSDARKRVKKGISFIVQCKEFAPDIINACFRSSSHTRHGDSGINRLLSDLYKTASSFGSKSFYTTLQIAIEHTGVLPAEFVAWIEQTNAHPHDDIAAHEKFMVFLADAIQITVSRSSQVVSFAAIAGGITEFVDTCRAACLPLNEELFAAFIATDKSKRSTFLANVHSSSQKILYSSEDIAASNPLAGFLCVCHTLISYYQYKEVCATLANFTMDRQNGHFTARAFALAVYKTKQQATNRHPQALGKLALAFENALSGALDFSSSQRKVQQNIETITKHLQKLPNKARKVQEMLLGSLNLTMTLFNDKHLTKQQTNAPMIVALTLVGSSNKALAYLTRLAGELFFREIIVYSTRTTALLEELNDLESDLGVFSCQQIAALCEVLGDCLDDAIEKGLDILWPKQAAFPMLLEQLTSHHKCWQAIQRSLPHNTTPAREMLKSMIIREFRNFWNYASLREELDVVQRTQTHTCKVSFVPAKTALDGFFGHIGETCLANCHHAILRPDFINVRIIDCEHHLWAGVIHVLLVYYQHQPAILLAGVEPCASLVAQIDNQALWAAVKTWAFDFAKQNQCHWVLQTINAAATSNRPLLADIIAQDFAGKETVMLDHELSFPGISEEMRQHYHGTKMTDYIRQLRQANDEYCFNVSACVVLGRIR